MLLVGTPALRSAPAWLRAIRTIAFCLVISLPFAGVGHATDEQSHAPLMVSAVQGDVTAISKGAVLILKPGTAIELPVSLHIGAKSALELQQGRTTISAAANSQLDIPIAAGTTETLERVIQTRGNVFYNVAKRGAQKLRVETPYLVAVIKGTQFNVAAQDLATTISLFEGRLEVHATDETDVVDLEAGHIAVRSSIAPMIRVLNMDTGETLRAGIVPVDPSLALKTDHLTPLVAVTSDGQPATLESAHTASTLALPGTTNTLAAADDHGVSSTLALNDLVARASGPAAGTVTSTSTGSIASGANGAGGSGSIVGGAGSSGGSIAAGAGSAGTSTNVNISAPGAAVDTSIASNISSGSAGTNLNTGVSAGAGTNVSAGAGAGVNTGAGTGTNINVNAGATVNTGAGINVNTGTNAGVSTGSSGTSVGVNTGTSVGTGAGTVVSAGANAGASTSSGLNLNLNLGIGGTNVNASVGTGGVGVGVTTETGDDKGGNNGNHSSSAGSSSSGQNSGNSSNGSNGHSDGTLSGLLKSLTKNKGK